MGEKSLFPATIVAFDCSNKCLHFVGGKGGLGNGYFGHLFRLKLSE